MKLSSKGQQAIKAMMSLAIHFNNKPVTLTEISNNQPVSVSYLEQLFSVLRGSGLVQGVRGPGGGYRLGKAPNQISIADIVLSVEESDKGKNKAKSSPHERALASNLWNKFSDDFTDHLDSISLADIVKDQVVVKTQFKLNETTRRISTMFPVTESLKVAC